MPFVEKDISTSPVPAETPFALPHAHEPDGWSVGSPAISMSLVSVSSYAIFATKFCVWIPSVRQSGVTLTNDILSTSLIGVGVGVGAIGVGVGVWYGVWVGNGVRWGGVVVGFDRRGKIVNN